MLRMHIGRALEMAESSSDRAAYENRIVERFGGQQELELIVPPPPKTEPSASVGPLFDQLEMKEAAN